MSNQPKPDKPNAPATQPLATPQKPSTIPPTAQKPTPPPTTQAQPKPSQLTIIDQLLAELQKKIKVTARKDSDRRATIIVDRGQLVEVAKILKEMGFDHVKAVTGIDYPNEEKLEVVYHVSSYEHPDYSKVIIALRTTVSYRDPVVPSLYSIWESVWTGERETHEMLGIVFEGHPDLRRLFLPDDFEGIYPLKKEYKLKKEGIFLDEQPAK